MAVSVKSGPLTPADTLRDLLTQCEARLVSPGEGGRVPELFTWLDQIADLWPDLEAMGGDLRAEQARWESVQAQLLQRGDRLLKEWPKDRPLAEMRRVQEPDDDRWWWWLDQHVARRRRKRLLRGLGLVVVVAGILVVMVLLFNRLFPVDPTVQRAYRLQTDAAQALQQGDLDAARGYLSEAVTVDSESPELWTLYGAVAEALGDVEGAEEAWDEALRTLDGDEGKFYMQRGRAFIQVAQPEAAIQDELAALEYDPQMPEAHFLLGVGYEFVGDYGQALEAYTTAADLAGDDNPELIVLARTRMASLLQRPDLHSSPVPTP